MPPVPDYDEVFIVEDDPEEVARRLVNTPADEDIDRAEAEGTIEP